MHFSEILIHIFIFNDTITRFFLLGRGIFFMHFIEILIHIFIFIDTITSYGGKIKHLWGSILNHQVMLLPPPHSAFRCMIR